MTACERLNKFRHFSRKDATLENRIKIRGWISFRIDGKEKSERYNKINTSGSSWQLRLESEKKIEAWVKIGVTAELFVCNVSIKRTS